MLEYVSLAWAIIMLIFIVFLVIYIHDIPYEIARKRNHPHADAIHIAGWVSLFLLHTIWPFLWIWAHLYKPGEKFLSVDVNTTETQENSKKIQLLETKIAKLTTELDNIQSASSQIKTQGV